MVVVLTKVLGQKRTLEFTQGKPVFISSAFPLPPHTPVPLFLQQNDVLILISSEFSGKVSVFTPGLGQAMAAVPI